MTSNDASPSNRLFPAREPSRGGDPRSARASITVLVACSAVLVVAFAASCSDDETTPYNYIGITDATPPRLGAPADGGALAR